ncbi:MAG: S-layer homology domain-containing protein [Clostridiales bacterium]|nr:S-layer homology domain-containing protein [Clostridiales bacterium]
MNKSHASKPYAGKFRKKLICAITALIFITQNITVGGISPVGVYALTDEFIFTDAVANTYTGRVEADALISNLTFGDMPGNPAYEAVTRMGALNVIKGYEDFFFPASPVSNAEMLSSVLRAMGRENDAIALAERLAPTLPEGSDLSRERKIGYLSLANQLGFITGAQYANVLAADQASLNPVGNFIYDAPVSRQQAAFWLNLGINQMSQTAFDGVNIGNVQRTYNFNDWKSVSAVNLTAVERLVSAGALLGDTEGNLRPNDFLTNAEHAQMFKALDSIYYNLIGVVKKNGTVGGYKDAAQAQTGSVNFGRDVYVRVSDGQIDVLKNYARASNSRPVVIQEVPVFRDSQVTGLTSLEEGDEIEYLVRSATNEVLYVQTARSQPVIIDYVTAKLKTIDVTAGTITVVTDDGSAVTFPMIRGLYFTEDEKNYVYIDYNKKTETVNIPISSTLMLRLKNSVCDEIHFIGEPNLQDEFRGIVIENNPDLGYLVVIDNNGKQIVKNFYESDIRVKKREYYDADDEIGYISEVFPNFEYNPLESDIYAVEPGDIVFIRNNPDDLDYIESISAATNYIAKYGKILQFTFNGDYYEMLLEYENKQTTWFDVSSELFITRNGKPADAESVVVGDWARVLVNQAIIAPGYVMESAKEIILESDGHYISTILRGQLSGMNAVQNQLLVQNVQELTNRGWVNHKQAANFNLTGRDTEYFYDNKQISLEYALKYFKRSDNEVYIALENNYAGEKVRKVTFRSGRDQLLNADTVIYSDGNGGFSVLGSSDKISTDAGTIVRRYGRLVSGNNINIPDYAVVSLNGGNNAAVVDISDAPGNSQVIMARGRVLSVDEGNDFIVQSMSVLTGDEWLYTPIAREFAIDYNTVYVTAEGITNLERLTDYNSAVDETVTTSVDKVYNILTDGARASRIIESPYCTRAVRGTVYAVDEAAGKIYLNSASYLSNAANSAGRWVNVSATSATLEITVHPNTFITKNNQTVGLGSIKTGEQLKIMTDNLPDRVTTGAILDGYMVFVEK